MGLNTQTSIQEFSDPVALDWLPGHLTAGKWHMGSWGDMLARAGRR